MTEEDPIRLLQLTDCHISADPGQYWHGCNPLISLQRICHYINCNETDVTAILATGDLSHDGSVESYHLLASCFRELNGRVYSLPGNHDSVAMHEVLSGIRHFITGNWLIVMLDSSVPGKEAGCLADSEIQYLHDVIDRHPECHVLVAVHHPPQSVGSAWIDAMKIENGDALIHTCTHFPQVHAVITGHVHQAHDIKHDNYRLMTAPSTCHQFLPGAEKFAVDPADPGYRWLELFEDGRIDTGIIRVGELDT